MVASATRHVTVRLLVWLGLLHFFVQSVGPQVRLPISHHHSEAAVCTLEGGVGGDRTVRQETPLKYRYLG